MSVDTIQLTITDEAAKQLKTLKEEQNQPAAFLRVWVAGGGCSGLTYGMALDDTKEEGDMEILDKDITLVVDPQSAQYLSGSTIEYQKDILGGGFKVNNPNAKQSCGCGSSFTTEEHQQSEEKSCRGCRCN